MEIQEDTFTPTPWVTSLTADPALPAVYGEFYAQLINPMFRSLLYFLKQKGFKNPTDVTDGNWQFWRGTANNLFQDLAINQDLARDFHAAMQYHSKYNLTPWPEFYPTGTVLSATKPDRALASILEAATAMTWGSFVYAIRRSQTTALSFKISQTLLKGFS